MDGWLKLSRKINNHWIWNDPVKLKWWIDILLTVNYEDNKLSIGYKIFECKRGQSLMSLQNWAKRWGVSKSVVNNFFSMLEKDSMITIENETVTTRITVCNYDTYQQTENAFKTEEERNENATKTQQSTIKERKEYKEREEYKKEDSKNEFLPISAQSQNSIPDKKPKEKKIQFLEFVSLSNAEHEKLIKDFGGPDTNELISILNNYKGSSGKKYKSDYLAIRNWVVDRLKEKRIKEINYEKSRRGNQPTAKDITELAEVVHKHFGA